MEQQFRTPKKLWSVLRLILYMLKKGVSKNIPWFEIHMMFKKSTKAIGNLLIDHHQTLTCRPNNIHSTFIPPRDYEFSFNNTPFFIIPKRKHRNKHNNKYDSHHHHHHHHHQLTVDNVKRVFDMLNGYEQTTPYSNTVIEPEKSPLSLLGFGDGKSVRQLRVTDSPFPVNNNEEDSFQVDKMAEEFIENFYNELKQQKKVAVIEPPSPVPATYLKWGYVR
ncbi:uncharacterized protein [Rutidosis leptorrhynchoides]|uniref:uncharacterized protein n=1 Tax=Rutidosis leptorrhynchoides TaxID=125765 RepID=UPI003A98F8A0